MKKIYSYNIIIILLLLFIQGCVNTGTIKSVRAVKDISEDKIIVTLAKKPHFFKRRRFTYLMAWNNIPIGSIVAEVGDVVEYKGRDAYKVRIVTRSNKFLSKIYNVEDVYVSYVDTETLTSLRYEANRSEGNYKKNLIVEYDFDKLEATYTNLRDGSIKYCPIEKEVHDPLSAMCYFMTIPVKPGDKVDLIVNLNEKNFDVYGEIEKIKAIRLPEMGTFPAFKVRPMASVKGKKYKKGKAWIYFSADQNRYPLYGVVAIPFGKVTATLGKVEDY